MEPLLAVLVKLQLSRHVGSNSLANVLKQKQYFNFFKSLLNHFPCLADERFVDVLVDVFLPLPPVAVHLHHSVKEPKKETYQLDNFGFY